MKFGLTLGQGAVHARVQGIAEAADSSGLDSMWVAEAYGADAVSALGFLSARTQRIALGSAVLSTAARTPATTAMTALTLNALSQGRFRLGLGVSGPQVVAGWHGRQFGSPVEELREYLDVIEQIARCGLTAQYEGRHYRIPPLGVEVKSIRSSFPKEKNLGMPPVYVGGNGPKMIELAAARAHGWIPAFYSPEDEDVFSEPLTNGLRNRRDGLGLLDIAPLVFVGIESPSFDAMRRIKERLAFFVGGMGSRSANFYKDLVTRFGFGEAAERIQDLYLSGTRDKAASAVPDDLVERIALVGSRSAIRRRLDTWERSRVSTIILRPVDESSLGDLLSLI